MEWIQGIAWTVVVLTCGVGGMFGGWCVALLRAAVGELVAIKLTLKATQGDVSTLAKTVERHGELHERHLADIAALQVAVSGNAGETRGG